MPEENAEVTEEQLVQAASQYDAAIEAGEEPEVTIEEQPESDEGDVFSGSRFSLSDSTASS